MVRQVHITNSSREATVKDVYCKDESGEVVAVMWDKVASRSTPAESQITFINCMTAWDAIKQKVVIKVNDLSGYEVSTFLP